MRYFTTLEILGVVPEDRQKRAYTAMKRRDYRFGGEFFLGATGIYCRPICPAQPKRENATFFHSRHEAELASYQ